MKILKNRYTWGQLFLLLAIPIPVRAFELTLFTDASLGQIHDDVSSTSVINQTDIPDGFGDYEGNGSTDDFFDSSFLLLGSEPDEGISANSSPPSVETNVAVFNGIEISTENENKDLIIEFDWIFQGDQEDVLGFDLDIFTVSLVGTSTDPLVVPPVDVDLELLATNQYGYGRDYSYTVEGGLLVGSYTLQTSVIETPDLPLTNILSVDNSAAGIDNISVRAIPFEFSPTLGLLIMGSFWGLSYFWKHKINSRKT